MLGPALTQFLHRLAKVPASRRTPQQTALLRELGLLYAALAPDDSAEGRPAVSYFREHGPAMRSEIQADLKGMIRAPDFWKTYSITVTEPARSSARICPICGADVP